MTLNDDEKVNEEDYAFLMKVLEDLDHEAAPDDFDVESAYADTCDIHALAKAAAIRMRGLVEVIKAEDDPALGAVLSIQSIQEALASTFIDGFYTGTEYMRRKSGLERGNTGAVLGDKP